MRGHSLKTTSASVLGVDTNVLVRFLADDDPVQTPQAIGLLTRPGNQPIHIAQVVMVEAFWVLTKVKKFPARDVIISFRRLLLSDHFIIEESAVMIQALDDAETAGCDLADALIAIVNARAGCEATATFDIRAGHRLKDMVVVEERL